MSRKVGKQQKLGEGTGHLSFQSLQKELTVETLTRCPASTMVGKSDSAALNHWHVILLQQLQDVRTASFWGTQSKTTNPCSMALDSRIKLRLHGSKGPQTLPASDAAPAIFSPLAAYIPS